MTAQRLWSGGSREALYLRALALTGLMVTLVAGGAAWFLLTETDSLVRQEAARGVRLHAERQMIRALSPADVASPMVGPAYERADAQVRESILGPEVVRVKVWNPQGTVVYSSLLAQVGETIPDNEGVRRALQGEASWKVGYVPESRFEMGEGRLMEVYFPLSWAPGQAPVSVGEVYVRYEPYARLTGSLRGKVLLTGLIAFMTLPLGLYLLYRTGWAGMLDERDRATQRLREVEGLNHLLQQEVAKDEDLREGLLHLRDELISTAAPPEGTAAPVARDAWLAIRIRELADLAGLPLDAPEQGSRGNRDS